MKTRQMNSWHYAIPGFEPILEQLRSGNIPEDSCRKIYENHGKVVCRCKIGGFDFAYKSQPVKWSKVYRFCFQPSLPAREFANYQFAKKLGIPVPEVYAVGDTRICFLLRETFLVTQYIDNTQDGRVFMKGGRMEYGYEELRHDYCKAHLAFLAKVHDAGYCHKTFHARNLLFRILPDSKVEYFWIDLARMKPFAKNIKKEIEHDLQELLGDLKLPVAEERELRGYYDSLRMNNPFLLNP